MKRVVWIFVVASSAWSCGNVESASDDSIAGVYVREYSREILNQLSGNKVGMRTIRDTIYISAADEGYKVENAKWRMNDYDNEGWRDMKHGESGPLPSFNASYNKESRTLTPESAGAVPDLVIREDGKLSVGNKSEIAYTKID